MTPALTLALLALASTAVSTPPAVPSPPTATESARLANGDVLLASKPKAKGSPAEEVGRGVVDAPPERVFAAVVDFAHYQEWVPFVQRSDAQREDDGSVISSQSLRLPFPAGSRHYRIHAKSEVEAEARVWRAWWSYVPRSGNVADHYGWWVLVPFGAGRTLATCLLYTDPGNLPAWAVHVGSSETMPYIFSGLRQQVRRSRYAHP